MCLSQLQLQACRAGIDPGYQARGLSMANQHTKFPQRCDASIERKRSGWRLGFEMSDEHVGTVAGQSN